MPACVWLLGLLLHAAERAATENFGNPLHTGAGDGSRTVNDEPVLLYLSAESNVYL